MLSTYQLRFNQTNFEADAYEMCVNNTLMECSDYLFKETQVISQLKEVLLAEKGSSNNINKVLADIKNVDSILKDGTEDEKKTIYHNFYQEKIGLVME